MPIILNTPTFTICAVTLLDTGSEEQKRQRISAAIRGDEILVQLLSEPSGGSDLAGVITRADRRGDKWVINGAKTWSTSAFAADYGLLLARTNWDVPWAPGTSSGPHACARAWLAENMPRVDLRGVLRRPGTGRRCRRRRGQ